jgi:hypothetical protein
MSVLFDHYTSFLLLAFYIYSISTLLRDISFGVENVCYNTAYAVNKSYPSGAAHFFCTNTGEAGQPVCCMASERPMRIAPIKMWHEGVCAW